VHANVQKLVSVVKMVTILEECSTEEQNPVVCLFLSAKELNVKDVHKEMFPVYGGKCLSRKAVQPLWQTFR
jgi:hypothetical protein